MIEPFLLRAAAAGIGLGLVAAPLGCFVVWQRMAYIGETMAQAGLIGVALGLLLRMDVTASVLVVTIGVAVALTLLSRQSLVPLDSILGLLAHGALAVGVILTSVVRSPSVDLMGYLFGDIFAVSTTDLIWVWGGGMAVLGTLAWLWQPLLAISLNSELAAAEGVDRERVRAIFMGLLAVAIAIAIKIVGVLLVIAFLIMPAAAARPFSSTPERMAVIAAAIASLGVIAGLALSASTDTPGGPAIVIVLSAIALAALLASARREP